MNIRTLSNQLIAASLIFAALVLPSLARAAVIEQPAVNSGSLVIHFDLLVKPGVQEVVHQARLVHKAYEQLELANSLGDYAAIDAAQKKLKLQQGDFLQAQYQLRAQLLRIQDDPMGTASLSDQHGSYASNGN